MEEFSSCLKKRVGTLFKNYLVAYNGRMTCAKFSKVGIYENHICFCKGK